MGNDKKEDPSPFDALTSIDTPLAILVHLLVAAGVVSFWRNSWVLIDEYLCPDDMESSAWWSLVIGIILFIITFLMQPFLVYLYDNSITVVLDFLYTLVLGESVVFYWRGIWYLWDVHHEDSAGMKFLGLFLSFGFLILLEHANSILAPPGCLMQDWTSNTVDYNIFGKVLKNITNCDREERAERLKQTYDKQVEKIKQRKAGFVIGDADGDGILSVEETCALLEKAGVKWSEKRVKGLLIALDENGDGKVKEDEFADALDQLGKFLTLSSKKMETEEVAGTNV